MKRLNDLFQMDELTHYVLTRGILLCCTLLAAALLMLVWTGPYTYSTAFLYFCAAELCDSALMVLGAGMLGAILLEDMLRST